MAKHKLARPFTVASYTFQPAATGSAKMHRLRLPLRFTGRDPVAVVDFATRVRGEPLLVRFDMKDGAPPVEAVGRLEGAGVKIAKGSKKPPVTLRLAFESEEVVPIDAVLQAGLRAARAGLLEVDLELELVQERLPGLEEDGAEDGKSSTRPDGAPLLEGPGSRSRPGRKRRPKGSSPSP